MKTCCKHFLYAYFEKKSLSILLSIFILLRVFSFLTYHHPIANQIIAGILVLAFIITCKKNLAAAWIILVGELLLDGAGHFFELEGLLLRTWFLGIFGIFWLWEKIKFKKISLPLTKEIMIPLLGVGVVIVFSLVNGFLKQHAPIHILQDAILYFFLLLLFPAVEFYNETRKFFIIIIKTYIVGSALFSLFSFFFYSTGFGSLPDLFYHWYRNIAVGKITDLGNNFFRIVLSEHLFIVPLLLVLTSFLLKNPKNKKLWLFLFLSSITLVLNFSRIYFVALAAGLLILFFKHSWKRWFFISTLVVLCIFCTFVSLSLFASRGKSIGLELLGGRVSGATVPANETSGAIRLAILPQAIQIIKTHPLLGSGLGATVTYIDPTTQKEVTRTQFDWGYLEVLAEIGIVGTLIFLLFLFSLLIAFAKYAYTKKYLHEADIPLWRGLLAGALSLFVINLTTPALFHGFGILYFVFLLTLLSKKSIQGQSQERFCLR